MPNPPMILKTTSWLKSPQTAQPMAETLNIRAEMSIVFFLPRWSLIIPAVITPRIEPIRAQPTYHPSAIVVSRNWFFTISVVPEITAVS